MKLTQTLLFIIALCTAAIANDENALTWPREIDHEEGKITIYQPELEEFKADQLIGRMAISVKPKEGDLVFGALRFNARIETDTDERVVVMKSMDITDAAFPDGDEAKIKELTDYIEGLIDGKDLEMSLDHILANLEIIEDRASFSDQMNNTPPDIYFRTEPAILVYIDGDPILQDTDTKNVKYVANTPFFIVQDTKKKLNYIKGGKWWYSSNQLTVGWELTTKVPSSIKKMAEEVMDPEAEQDSAMQAMDTAPDLIVVTGPAELVQTDGEPEYAPVQGTSLLYVKNTESDILTDINTQDHYLLLAGRWYYSRTLDDHDWQFQEPSELPDDFANIPDSTDISNVRSSVPGTEEARSAVLEQTIPQTATVDRKTATVEVSYDGNPEFKKIDGTDVAYAVNCDKDVLLINNMYYCVDDGIWFQSEKATGPWEVSVIRPDEVDQIPPEEPVYNTKYVYIYDSTPDVVYVGYLPGYTCSYVYGGVVVYGTGWWYRPWYRTVYYPRPVTYGFGVHWNPWTGWGFSFGMSWGWFNVRVGGGWWGPAGYRYGYRHGYRRGYHHGYRRGFNAGYRAGYAAGRRSAGANNVYRNRSSGVRSTGVASNRANAANRASAQNRAGAGNANRAGNAGANNRAGTQQGRPSTGQAGSGNRAQTRPSQQPNNVYSDKSGNVYRRENNGNVQQRNQGNWNNSTSPSRNSQVDRSHQSRQQGSRNYNNYNSGRARSGGGGARAGGGRRR